MNVQIPAPGSRGIAVVENSNGSIKLIEVHIYPPEGKFHITLPGEMFGPHTFPDKNTAQREVQKALANNPVAVVELDKIK